MENVLHANQNTPFKELVLHIFSLAQKYGATIKSENGVIDFDFSNQKN